MSQVARIAAGATIEFKLSARPFSNFDFAEEKLDPRPPLRRILSQVRQHGGQSIVVEHLSNPQDIQEENEDIKSLCPLFDSETSKCVRLSFFSARVSSVTDLAEIDPSAFLGYAIYKEDKVPPTPDICPEGYNKGRIYESVLKPSRHDNNFVHGAPPWDCRVGDCFFPIEGYLYAQQNTITNCCAHVALRTVATRFTHDDITYRQINDLVKKFREIHNGPDSPPGQGLTNEEICYVLDHLGAKTFVGDYTNLNPPPVAYQKYLYGAIESGFPAILIFEHVDKNGELGCHAVPAFGHTFNEDTWVIDADRIYFPFHNPNRTLSSGSWVTQTDRFGDL